MTGYILLCFYLTVFSYCTELSGAESPKYHIFVDIERINGSVVLTPITIETALATYREYENKINYLRKNITIINVNCDERMTCSDRPIMLAEKDEKSSKNYVVGAIAASGVATAAVLAFLLKKGIVTLLQSGTYHMPA